MNTKITWQDGMKFKAQCNQNTLTMDAKPPLGKDEGMTPKELVAVGLSGCTAMDVIALLKKFKQEVTKLDVESDIKKSSGGYPEIFESILLTFRVDGRIEKDKLLHAIELSQTRYCGVSAMLSKTTQIIYDVILNGEKIGTGKADFSKGASS